MHNFLCISEKLGWPTNTFAIEVENWEFWLFSIILANNNNFNNNSNEQRCKPTSAEKGVSKIVQKRALCFRLPPQEVFVVGCYFLQRDLNHKFLHSANGVTFSDSYIIIWGGLKCPKIFHEDFNTVLQKRSPFLRASLRKRKLWP